MPSAPLNLSAPALPSFPPLARRAGRQLGCSKHKPAGMAGSRDPLAAVAIGGYLAVSGLMPLFNKALFTLFPFPVTATVVQICAVAALLLLATSSSGGSGGDYGSTRTKARLLLLPSMFFVGNITLTNLGIHLTDVNVHILLRASELIWVVFLGAVSKQEPWPSRGLSAACAMLMLGVVLVSCGAGGEVGALAVGVTLLSALFSACHVITIRRAMITLMESARAEALVEGPAEQDDEEEVGLLSPKEYQEVRRSWDQQAANVDDGQRRRYPATEQDVKIPSGKVPELLMFKMGLSMIFLVPAALLEHSRLTDGTGDGVTAWAVLGGTSEDRAALVGGAYFGRSCVVPALALGVVFTMAFQGMMIAMATRIRALSIGFVAQCKVLP